ncbi:MAG: hypothetical protein KatS3mg002_1155 [Candidatus Woesearchaeota archaeon]|nr:MAG: hypothetical protein KatS3mg002_1155 [Candidatus Woesearchaeota archaeon]
MCKCHNSIDEHIENTITYNRNSNANYVSNQPYIGNTQYMK